MSDQPVPKVKRWALLVVALYALTLVALTFPVVVASFWTHDKTFGELADGVLSLARTWQYWLVIGILSLLEGLFLLAPMEIARNRPVPKRRWLLLATVAGLLIGLLIAGATVSAGEILVGDAIFSDKGLINLMVGGALGLIGWVVWGVVFWRMYGAGDESALKQLCQRLLHGTILELLIAVPSHIYVRNKNYCCAGAGTFLGIAAGLAVMLFSFGPGVLFLFADRIRRLRGPEATLAQGPLQTLETHGKDALILTLAAILFLTLPFGVGSVLNGVPSQLLEMCLVSFFVLSAAAIFHALRAYKYREPLWGMILFGGACLFELNFIAAVMAYFGS